MESKDWRGFESFSPISLLKRRTGVPADLDPPTKLSENVILDVLTEIDNTLRSSAYESMFFIQNMQLAAGNDPSDVLF